MSSYSQHNDEQHRGGSGRHQHQRALSRPSATSLEYEGRSSSHTASIHNIIEQQSWERRLGISDHFDPERRGHTFSRDGRAGDCGNDNNHRYPRERSRDRYDDGRPSKNNNDNGDFDSRNGGYREQDHVRYVDTRNNATNSNRSHSHRDSNDRSHNRHDRNERRRDDQYDEKNALRNIHEGHGTDYPRQRDDRDRRSPSREYQNRDFNNRPSNQSYGGSQGSKSRSSGNHQPRPHGRDQYNGARVNDRRRENGGGGPGYGISHASGNGAGQDNGCRESNARQQAPPPGDDSGWDTVPNRTDRRKARRKRDNDEPPPPSIEFLPPNAANGKYQQFMLMLTGVPGSGKSTFAESLVAGKPWMYVRVNQDTLGNRRECEDLTRRILKDGKCPVIDRCNFNPAQRKHFLDIAVSFSVPVDCIVFQYGMDLCIRRCQSRRNHETITPQIAVEVVQRMVQQFSPPLPNRINSETFRNLKTVASLNSFNDLVMEYLNLIS